jgi:ArsR family transcriptional regulator, lead/cadmium/zinc/bismuth-responsive transcriptional repressor
MRIHSYKVFEFVRRSGGREPQPGIDRTSRQIYTLMYMEVKEMTAATPMSDAETTCQVFVTNAPLVAELKHDLGDVSEIATLFQLLGDPSRCAMLLALGRGRELCVCDLAEITGLSLPTTSHHLRKLRERGLVASRREGKLVFYRLADPVAEKLLGVAVEAGTPVL